MSVQAGQVGWVFKRYAQIIDQWKAAIPELIDSNLEASSLKPTEISGVPLILQFQSAYIRGFFVTSKFDSSKFTAANLRGIF